MRHGGLYVNIGYGKKKRWIFAGIFLVVSVQLVMRAANDIRNKEVFRQTLYESVFGYSIQTISPMIPYVNGDWTQGSITEKVWQLFYGELPLGMCVFNSIDSNFIVEDYMQEDNEIIKAVVDENREAAIKQSDSDNSIDTKFSDENTIEMGINPDANMDIGLTLEDAVLAENTVETGSFVPVRSPVAVYSRQQLVEPGFIKKTFYAEDATTYIREDQLDYNTLMGFDATVKQDNSNVQILIYHTHSQETYIDSIPGDSSTSIVGVGEHLSEILRTQYGFNVLHHTGEYDVESRDYAYSNAAIGLEKVLAENPTIEVMIDLHRDETNPNTKLVTTIQDKTMAKFMFFNGLCYTRALGSLTNLPNPYVQDNISFAFQMQLAAEEHYPGLTRRIYLKGYRYNLHYRSKSLLIELGSQTNTVEEAMNSCEPLAHIIAMILNGENKENMTTQP